MVIKLYNCYMNEIKHDLIEVTKILLQQQNYFKTKINFKNLDFQYTVDHNHYDNVKKEFTSRTLTDSIDVFDKKNRFYGKLNISPKYNLFFIKTTSRVNDTSFEPYYSLRHKRENVIIEITVTEFDKLIKLINNK